MAGSRGDEDLDGNYTIFGQVVAGMKVVKSIEAGDKILSMRIKND
jgi:cyclophilin family peptidyl-prolyl cis-trans isomerase